MMEKRNSLISEGISKVKNLGFNHVNTENIFYDEVYSAYFEKMLLLKIGADQALDPTIRDLIREIEHKTKTNI